MKQKIIGITFSVMLLSGCGGIDTKDASSVESYLTEDYWAQTKEGGGWEFVYGGGSYNFKDDGTFTFSKVFNNDGVNTYTGTWSVSPGDVLAKVHVNFNNSGEYTNAMGSSFTFDLSESECLSANGVKYWHTTGRD